MINLRKNLPPLSALMPFEATARLGSLTKAGNELGLTQAAISKQIKALEDNLGCKLFERRNRAVYTTETGLELQQIIAAALMSIAHASEDIRMQSSGGEIVLRSQLCEGFYWLMPRLSGFYQQHPQLPVRVSVSTKPITEAEERFDLALQTTSRTSGNAQLIFSASDEVFPVCSPDYLQPGNPINLDRLANLHLLHHSIQPQDWIDWDHWLKEVGSTVRVGESGTSYDSYPMMIQAALEGHGIALGWQRTVDKFLKSGLMVKPFAESLYLPEGLSIYQPADRKTHPGTSTLLDWLKTEFCGNESSGS